ncbi:MAG TPA: inorganic phosphate transporter [Gemmatimonadaceae bacterium]|nr:inorganic phosphate transporter [Gemmatimonadaceae bacterium]
MVTYVIVIIAIAFLFDFSNGFHDSANSIATVVGTRVLSPLVAVAWAAFFNLAAAFLVGTEVARMVGQGMIEPAVVDPNVILGALIGAILWNIITWLWGLPSSSTHALLGGYGGAAIAKAGFGAVIPAGWTVTILFIVISPVLGMVLGYALMVAVYWIFRRMPPGKVDHLFRTVQLGSSAFLSFMHGANDAQKTMGIIVVLLVSTRKLFAERLGTLHHLYVPSLGVMPRWVELGAYGAISLGTLFGGWRIVRTMGSRITRLRPVGGFCAETGGALSIMLATHFGIPVSTTHTITGSIVGVGATTRLSAVRWGVASRIVWAWILTIPAAAVMAAIAWMILHAIVPAF